MKGPIIASLVFLAAAVPVSAQVQQQPNPDVEDVADTRADAPTRIGRRVPLCSATVTDECMNPSQAPRGYRDGKARPSDAATDGGNRHGRHKATRGKHKKPKAHRPHRGKRHGPAPRDPQRKPPKPRAN